MTKVYMLIATVLYLWSTPFGVVARFLNRIAIDFIELGNKFKDLSIRTHRDGKGDR